MRFLSVLVLLALIGVRGTSSSERRDCGLIELALLTEEEARSLSIEELVLEHEELTKELRGYAHCDRDLVAGLQQSLTRHFEHVMRLNDACKRFLTLTVRTRIAYEPQSTSEACNASQGQAMPGTQACTVEDNVDYPGDACSSPLCQGFDLAVVPNIRSAEACCEECHKVPE
eukprot:385340-Hanusia_phi.AAC.1